MKEEWRDIPGYEGRYQISNLHRVKSLPKRTRKGERLMFPKISTAGYLTVGLFDKEGKKHTCQVHRLIAEAFIPNPESKPCVNHIDGDKRNNSIENLEWVTYKENTGHAYSILKRERYTIPVRCIETGVVYKSAAEAQRKTGANRGSISSVINKVEFKGKDGAPRFLHRAGGYHWEKV